MYSTCSLHTREEENKKSAALDPSTSSYEIFRNNTTAVEVIIKEVSNKRKKKEETSDVDIPKEVNNEILSLKNDLSDAFSRLVTTKNGFRVVINEMTKHLQVVSNRELESQTKIVSLQLENEKLKTLLESKSNLVNKLRKELVSMKRILKLVIKGLSYTPSLPEISLSSDVEYKEFEKTLNKDTQNNFSPSIVDEKQTFDSTFSKDLNSYEK